MAGSRETIFNQSSKIKKKNTEADGGDSENRYGILGGFSSP